MNIEVKEWCSMKVMHLKFNKIYKVIYYNNIYV
jgi:hypothetical protein